MLVSNSLNKSLHIITYIQTDSQNYPWEIRQSGQSQFTIRCYVQRSKGLLYIRPYYMEFLPDTDLQYTSMFMSMSSQSLSKSRSLQEMLSHNETIYHSVIFTNASVVIGTGVFGQIPVYDPILLFVTNSVQIFWFNSMHHFWSYLTTIVCISFLTHFTASKSHPGHITGSFT